MKLAAFLLLLALVAVAQMKFFPSSKYDTEIVSGYNKGLMKSYKGILSETDLKTIIDYLKTLNEKK